jgi:predicted nucleic acid-binding protein
VNGFFLLDTNVISELIKSEPDGNVLRCLSETNETILFMSVLTLGEVRSGIDDVECFPRQPKRKVGPCRSSTGCLLRPPCITI